MDPLSFILCATLAGDPQPQLGQHQLRHCHQNTTPAVMSVGSSTTASGGIVGDDATTFWLYHVPSERSYRLWGQNA